MKRQKIVALLSLLTILSACHSGGVYVPVFSVGDRPARNVQYHTVSKGDTLYSIAFSYGLDYKILARANGIGEPYVIVVGRKLKIGRVSNRKTVAKSSKTKRQKNASKARSKKVGKTTKSESQYAKLNWRWPMPGKVVSPYSLTGKVNKGIDIQGELGESVFNAADGVVVYAGGGLRGYGKLVIVKHNDHFLSAYGHNRAILVKEGEIIKGGQKVAEIGSSDSNQKILHFEIRKDGKPEDPLNYLPNRRGEL